MNLNKLSCFSTGFFEKKLEISVNFFKFKLYYILSILYEILFTFFLQCYNSYIHNQLTHCNLYLNLIPLLSHWREPKYLLWKVLENVFVCLYMFHCIKSIFSFLESKL